MTDKIVEEAYARVRSRFADDVWLGLPQRAITEAIYQEMRTIDAERLQSAPAAGPDPVTSAAA